MVLRDAVGDGDRPWGTADSLSSALAGWLTSSFGVMTSSSREWRFGGQRKASFASTTSSVGGGGCCPPTGSSSLLSASSISSPGEGCFHLKVPMALWKIYPQ